MQSADAPVRLPDELRRVAETAGAARVNAAAVRAVRLTQRGEMRLKPGGRWLPFRAEQTMSVRTVSFRWRARVRLMPLVRATVEDALEDGRGRLAVKLFGLLPVASAGGPSIDQGEIQRYLAELAWNPLALLANPHLQFASGEDGARRVWCGKPEAHVDLHLDSDGRIVRTFSRTRPRDGNEPAPWEGHFTDYAGFDGLCVPRRGEVAWLLPDGRFDCWRGTLTSYTCIER